MKILVNGTPATAQNSILLDFPNILPRIGLGFSLNELRRLRAISVERFNQSDKNGKPQPDTHHVRLDFDTPTVQQLSSGSNWHYYRTPNLGSAKNANRVCRIMTRRIADFIFQNQGQL